MLRFLQIFLTFTWWLSLFVGSRLGNLPGKDNAVIFCFATALLLSIPVSAVWTPFLANILFGGLVEMMSDGNDFPVDDYVVSWIEWMKRRKFRRMVVLLCFIEAVLHPELPAPFIIGMKHAKPGSWMENFFAWRVFRFNNARNCKLALEILRRRGFDPGAHPDPQVNLLLTQWSEPEIEAQKNRVERAIAGKSESCPPEVPNVGKNGTQRLPLLGNFVAG
jgi:hypothetical protein